MPCLHRDRSPRYTKNIWFKEKKGEKWYSISELLKKVTHETLSYFYSPRTTNSDTEIIAQREESFSERDVYSTKHTLYT